MCGINLSNPRSRHVHGSSGRSKLIETRILQNIRFLSWKSSDRSIDVTHLAEMTIQLTGMSVSLIAYSWQVIFP
ncbi:unnamed protein product [Caenorhabditis brenneri]